MSTEADVATTPGIKEQKAPRTDTRQRILDISARLFACHGYAGTSIRDIAQELGVTKAALYYHFDSKEAILTEMLAHPVQQIRAVLEVDRDLGTPEARRAFLGDIIGALVDCDQDTVAVFKDPLVAPLVNQDLTVAGVTEQISMRLAAALSEVADPTEAKPEHVLRAVAAVAAGHEAIHAWHSIYPERLSWSAEDIELIAGMASAVLESGK